MSAVLNLNAGKPENYFVLDIETGNAPAEAVQAAVEKWKAPGNIKDIDKIAARKLEAAAKIGDKAALLDASPILCIALKSETSAIVLNGMDGTVPEIPGVNVWPCLNERGMLIALRAWLDDKAGPETQIIGHNIRAFDLPKIRNAFVRHKLRLPQILAPQIQDGDRTANVIDTASLFKAFSMEHRDYFCTGLDTVATTLGIERPKTVVSGADVPKMHEAGQVAEILTYCAIDTICTERAYLLMTGQAGDLQ
jgi:hypothetical protein